MILTSTNLLFYNYDPVTKKYPVYENISKKLNGEEIKKIGQIKDIFYAITAKEVYVRGKCVNYSGLCTKSFEYKNFTKFEKPPKVTKIQQTYYTDDTFVLVD